VFVVCVNIRNNNIRTQIAHTYHFKPVQMDNMIYELCSLFEIILFPYLYIFSNPLLL
jgi:hypothetical protein